MTGFNNGRQSVRAIHTQSEKIAREGSDMNWTVPQTHQRQGTHL
jgi:hypothetical protein